MTITNEELLAIVRSGAHSSLEQRARALYDHGWNAALDEAKRRILLDSVVSMARGGPALDLALRTIEALRGSKTPPTLAVSQQSEFDALVSQPPDSIVEALRLGEEDRAAAEEARTCEGEGRIPVMQPCPNAGKFLHGTGCEHCHGSGEVEAKAKGERT